MDRKPHGVAVTMKQNEVYTHVFHDGCSAMDFFTLGPDMNARSNLGRALKRRYCWFVEIS